MRLYDIPKEIEACVDTETGEIIDIERLDALKMERDEKVSNIACFIKDLAAEEQAIGAEIQSLMKRRKAAGNKKENLKRYLAGFLKGQRFKDGRCSIGYRKTQHLEIAEGASIPDEFLKRTVTVDKKGLTDALKAGGIIEGVSLVEGQNIQIR